MSDPEALKQIDATMDYLVRRFDTLDHEDFDVDAADGKLTIAFENGDRFILSRQGATSQIWLAEPSGGWHFNWNGTHWICDKRNIELIQNLEDLIAIRLGEIVDLR
jgi:CyaY protein